MCKISIVFSGPKYREYSIDYAIDKMAKIFPGAEIIISSNDKVLISDIQNNTLVNKVISLSNIGELPSLKFGDNNNNNVNKQRQCCLEGIKAAKHDLVLRLRTDQLILDGSILDLWEKIKPIPSDNNKRGRIITSSIFSINPRFSERMPYHIGDMLQLGYKDDLLSYFSAPAYPFEYATWYEKATHHPSSNEFEKKFRSKYAVEQWLALHYIFGEEKKFPIRYHNDCNNKIIKDFENSFIEYFVIAHPSDINLRASKFSDSESFYNTQCYSTKECLSLLALKHSEAKYLVECYSPKGMNKQYYSKIRPIIHSGIARSIIKCMTKEQKNFIKKTLTKIIK